MELFKSMRIDSIFAHSSKAVYNYVIYNTSVEFTKKGKLAFDIEDNILNFKVTISKINEKENVISKYVNAAQSITINKILDMAKNKGYTDEVIFEIKEELNGFRKKPEEVEHKIVTIAG